MDKFDLITSIIFTILFTLLGLAGIVGAIIIKMFYPAILGIIILLSALILYRDMKQELTKRTTPNHK